MTVRFQKFVEKTVQQIEGNQQEKEDLFEELMTHLQLSKEQFIMEGLTEEEAEIKAMEHFGNEAKVGEEIQQAMFPYRKEMMRFLAVSSIIFSFAIYSVQLFFEGDAYILWLVLSIVISTSLLIFSIQSSAYLNRRLWMNSLLIIHIATYLFGALLSTGVTEPFLSRPLTIIAVLIILFAIALIYRTTIHDYNPSNHPFPKHAKSLHIINMTAGVIVIGVMLFLIWGMLVMIGSASPVLVIPLVPLLVWIILYILQMNLLRKQRIRLAYSVAVIPSMIILLFLVYFLFMVRGV